MDWLQAATTLLQAPPTPSCPQLLEALAHVEAGELEQATAALESLDETQRLMATLVVEMAAAPQADRAELTRACEALHALPKNIVDLSDIPHPFLTAWAEVVGTKLPAELVAARDGFGYAQRLTCHVVEVLCARGEAEAALPYAEQIDAHWRDDVAKAWARVGLGLAQEHEARGGALLRAGRAGNARPMIQDGGEEAEAHGHALAAFAKGGLAADHEAVTTAYAGLRKLARTRARKDVRSYGTKIASEAAGLRALESKDAGWLELAVGLHERIWTDSLALPTAAAIALTEHALGQCSDAQLEARARKLVGSLPQPAQELLRNVAAGRVGAEEQPEDLAALARDGVDVSERMEAALEVWDGYGDKRVKRFRRACRLSLSDARLEQELERVAERDRAEALVEGAHYGFRDEPERKAAYLARGYPEGDAFGIYSANMLEQLSLEQLRSGERYYARTGSTSALTAIIAAHVGAGRIEDAARAIAMLAQPRVSDEPWVPSYRRGNRQRGPAAEPAPIAAQSLDAAALKAALKPIKQARELYELARSVEGDAPSLAKVIEASRLKKWAKKSNAPWLAPLRLLEGDVEGALEQAEKLCSGRIEDSNVARLAACVASELERGSLELSVEACGRLATAVAKSHPQFIAPHLPKLCRVLLERVAPAQRSALVTTLEGALVHRYRMQGDRTYVHIGIARGLANCGDMEQALARVRRATRLASQRAIYFKGPGLARELAAMRSQLEPADYEAAMLDALSACLTHENRQYAQLMHVECSLLYAWQVQDSKTGVTWLAREGTPKVIARDVERSIWADIALVPDALDVLAAIWPREAVVPELARECIGAAVHALRAAQAPCAEAVAALL